MRLEQSFEVSAPIARVWQALTDVERVAPCLPGAQITGRGADGSYEGAFSVKIGPTSAAYTGRLQMTEIDESAHRATMKAEGTDRRGQGGASATIVSTLAEISREATRVEVNTDYRITGRLARFGRGGMIEDISQKLLRQFAENLQASLNEGGGGTGAEPAAGPRPADEPAVTKPEAMEPEATKPQKTEPVAVPPRRHPPSERTAPPVAPFPGPAPPSIEPLDAGSLVGGVLLERIRRNPVLLVVLAAAFILRRRRAR